MAYSDVYRAQVGAKHCFIEPRLNITLTALLCLIASALSITAEGRDIWMWRVCLCSPKEALYGM